jgi:hypothetical protein
VVFESFVSITQNLKLKMKMEAAMLPNALWKKIFFTVFPVGRSGDRFWVLGPQVRQ